MTKKDLAEYLTDRIKVKYKHELRYSDVKILQAIIERALKPINLECIK